METALQLHANTVFVRIEGHYVCGRWFSLNTNNPILYDWVAAMAYIINNCEIYKGKVVFLQPDSADEKYKRHKIACNEQNLDWITLVINDSIIPKLGYDPRIRSFQLASSDIRQYFNKATTSDDPEHTKKRKLAESPESPDEEA